LRIAVTVVAVGYVVRLMLQEEQRLEAYHVQLRPGWLLLSGALYLAGLGPCAIFWWQAMRDSGARPTGTSTIASYFVGHLAKYMPGKGWVVLVRATMVRGPGLRASNAALSSFQETILMMGVGGLLGAALLIAVRLPHRVTLATVNCGVGVVLWAMASPAVLPRAAGLMLRPFRRPGAGPTQACRWRTLLLGTLGIAAGWWCMGLSLWATMVGLTGPQPAMELWPRLTAAVSVATVVGFVSFLPGGLGGRELVLVSGLRPLVGDSTAAATAIALRLVWVAAELAAAGVGWLLDRLWRPAGTTEAVAPPA
jgi:hypothetical protein